MFIDAWGDYFCFTDNFYYHIQNLQVMALATSFRILGAFSGVIFYALGEYRSVWQCNARYREKGVMGCANRHIDESTLEQVFIKLWNALMGNKDACNIEVYCNI